MKNAESKLTISLNASKEGLKSIKAVKKGDKKLQLFWDNFCGEENEEVCNQLLDICLFLCCHTDFQNRSQMPILRKIAAMVMPTRAAMRVMPMR